MYGETSLIFLYSVSTTASDRNGEKKVFKIIHPFHPLKGKQYNIVTIKQTWGIERVFYYDKSKKLKSLLINWTDLAPIDPFVAQSKGRSIFCLSDLLALDKFVDNLLNKNR